MQNPIFKYPPFFFTSMNNALLEQATTTYAQHFPPETCFERALFYSWDCSIKDCGFCYMSAHTKRSTTTTAQRSTASLLAEVILCKKLGWDIGFLSGGINSLTHTQLKDLLHKIHQTYGQKIWLNAGPISAEKLKEYQPYIKGVVGSIETINPELHKKVCPSKPIEPYVKMFEDAHSLGLQNAMSFIVGMGETLQDFELLKTFITTYNITKIHLYGLIPHKGTMFEHAQPPTPEYQATWITNIRCTFPKINIQCGIWEDRVNSVGMLLKAGANTISKFPATKKFGTPEAHKIEQQACNVGRQFNGTLTKMPEINIDEEIAPLPFEDGLKQQIKQKLQQYIVRMSKQKIILCEP